MSSNKASQKPDEAESYVGHSDCWTGSDTRPSDGHLTAGWRSVFSTLERAHNLDSTSVHWLVTDPNGVVDEVHRRGLGRFWSLFVASQGGVLAELPAEHAETKRSLSSGLFLLEELGSLPATLLDPGMISRLPT